MAIRIVGGESHERAPLRAPTFQSIFETEFDYVWNSLYRLGVRERDLEDVTHDVFLDVHRRLAQYDSSRPIRPWLFAFAFRAASDYRRRGKNRFELLAVADAVDTADGAPLPDRQIAAREDLALVAAALDAIDLERRAILIAHDLDECPIPELAATLGIALNTAYSRLRLARQDFARAVARLRARRGTK